MDYSQRIDILQTNLQPQQVFLLSRPADVQYYTGLVNLNPEERESFLVVSKNSATLLYPSFSPVTKIPAITYHPGHWPSDLVSVINTLPETDKNEILIDKSSLFVNEFEALTETQVKLGEINATVLWQQRIAKDEEEVLFLQKAGTITSLVMEKVISTLHPGQTEREIARQIEIEVRREGAEGTSFPSVVAFGQHAALPHHQPTDEKLTKETVVLIDMGAKYKGYCGDMTRTIWYGNKPSPQFVKVEKVVKKAYTAAIKKIAANCAGTEVDAAARDVIKEAGFGDKFIHTTGHGVGLEIHEQPSLYFKKEITVPINAVVTIEPGIYLEGDFGYRYENMVQVEKTAGKELTI